jgi:hypothetical protein
MPPNPINRPMTIQRTELFVPLTTVPSTGENREFRITVIPQAERTGEFQSLEAQVEELRNQPMSADVSRSGEAGQSGGTGPQGGGGTIHQQSGKVNFLPGKKNCEPRVMLQRDGERITNIRIQCSCGQVMDLACDYGDPQLAE